MTGMGRPTSSTVTAGDSDCNSVSATDDDFSAFARQSLLFTSLSSSTDNSHINCYKYTINDRQLHQQRSPDYETTIHYNHLYYQQCLELNTSRTLTSILSALHTSSCRVPVVLRLLTNKLQVLCSPGPLQAA